MINCNYCENFTSLHQAGARSIGWRLLEEPPGDVKDAACPVCSGRSGLPKSAPVLPGQIPLVDDIEPAVANWPEAPHNVHPDPSRCLLEIAAGMEDAASYGKGPKALQFYAERIRELALNNHESCDWH